MDSAPGPSSLSARELQIARAYSGGASYRQVAEQLFIAPTTVRTHLQTIYRKLGVSTKLDLLQQLQQYAPAASDEPAGETRTLQPEGAERRPSQGKGHNLPPLPVIVVLPFANLSGDPDQDYFADGLTEDIITRLSYLRGVSVFSRTSSFLFKSQTKKVEEICADLGAGYALEGSVRTAGDRLRVVAQLIDGESGTHLWANKYDRTLKDIFDLQDDITHQIVLALQVALSDGETAHVPGGTENYSAWESFQQGALAFLKYTAEDNLQARRLFGEALELDPGFTDAKTFQAWTYWQNVRSGFSVDRDGELAECRRILNALTGAGAATANVKHLEAATLLLEQDYDLALSTSQLAVSLGPSKLLGYAPAAVVNIYAGQFEAAAEILRDSIRTIPCTPTDTIYNLAVALSLLGEHDRAIPLAEEYVRRVPDDLYAYTTLAVAQGRAGSSTDATATMDVFRERFPKFRVADFAAHEPFRKASDLEKLVCVLRASGLPD